MIADVCCIISFVKRIAFILVLFFLIACGNDPKNYSEKYFSLREKIFEDTLRYTKENLNLEKSILMNQSDSSIVKVIHPHWERELKIITDADINRPSWRDKYETDSTFTGNHLNSISYTSTDEKLSVRKIEISFSDSIQTVERIQIQLEKNTLLNSTKTTISYTPDYGYDIFSSKKVILFREKTFLISGRLKKNDE